MALLAHEKSLLRASTQAETGPYPPVSVGFPECQPRGTQSLGGSEPSLGTGVSLVCRTHRHMGTYVSVYVQTHTYVYPSLHA